MELKNIKIIIKKKNTRPAGGQICFKFSNTKSKQWTLQMLKMMRLKHINIHFTK